MNRRTLQLVRAAVYQNAVWLVCVLGAARGHGLLAAAGVTPLIVHALCEQPRRVLSVWTLAVTLLGGALDTGMATAGLIEFHDTPWPAALAPPWLLAIWTIFGATFPPLLGWLKGRPWLAAMLGALSGPLTYAAGAALGAAHLPQPAIALPVYALLWAGLLPLLAGCLPAPAHEAVNSVRV